MKRRVFWTMTSALFFHAVLVADTRPVLAQDESALIAQYDAASRAANWPLAESIARRLIATNPQDWNYHRRLAEAQSRSGKYLDALASFQKATEIASFLSSFTARDAVVEMFVAKGNLYLKMGDPKLAVVEYDAALQADPNQAVALYGRGLAQIRNGHTKEGEADRAAARALNPSIEGQFSAYDVK